MKAFFVPGLSGPEQCSGILGELRTAPDSAKTVGGLRVLEGETLDAIRAENGITPSALGRKAAAKERARVDGINAHAQTLIGALFGNSDDAEKAALRKGLAIQRKRALALEITPAEAVLDTQLAAANDHIENIRSHARALIADPKLTPAWP